MSVAHTPAELEPTPRALTIGTFDGVHLGHRRVLDAAQDAGLRSTVITFDPHPRTFRGNRVELLATPERRLELLAAAGIDDVLVLAFDAQLAALTPEAFVDSFLRPIGVEVVVEGEGFRFGHQRSGTLDLLAQLGFDARLVPLVGSISSSHIRRLLAAGDVTAAAALLGRPAEVSGTVVLGDQRGGTLGFPTANLAVPPDLLVPMNGIYAGSALGRRVAVSIGTNVHYGGTERRVEAYLLDYDGDLYGQELVIELWERLRDEAAFESEAALIAAIASDVERTRAADRPDPGRCLKSCGDPGV
jgi:riboflavin kinase/FMN adenylyltransferase